MYIVCVCVCVYSECLVQWSVYKENVFLVSGSAVAQTLRINMSKKVCDTSDNMPELCSSVNHLPTSQENHTQADALACVRACVFARVCACVHVCSLFYFCSLLPIGKRIGLKKKKKKDSGMEI